MSSRAACSRACGVREGPAASAAPVACGRGLGSATSRQRTAPRPAPEGASTTPRCHFRDELRILGQPERFVPVRLECKGLPDAGDRGRTQAALGGRRAHAPVRRPAR